MLRQLAFPIVLVIIGGAIIGFEASAALPFTAHHHDGFWADWIFAMAVGAAFITCGVDLIDQMFYRHH